MPANTNTSHIVLELRAEAGAGTRAGARQYWGRSPGLLCVPDIEKCSSVNTNYSVTTFHEANEGN